MPVRRLGRAARRADGKVSVSSRVAAASVSFREPLGLWVYGWTEQVSPLGS